MLFQQEKVVSAKFDLNILVIGIILFNKLKSFRNRH